MANNRIAYGLAKKYGIDTKGMTPRQVWEALSDKGISAHEEHKKNAKKSIEELKELAKVPLDYFGKKGHKQPDVSTEIPPVPKEAFGFKDDRLYIPDHVKHAKEMGYKDPKQYESAAIDFWAKGTGKIYYSKMTKAFYKYNQKNEEFLVVDHEGYVKTFFYLSLKKFERKRYQDKINDI